MNSKKNVLILMISVCLSSTCQQEELQIEKNLSLHLALRLGKIKVEGNQASYPHYDDEKKIYSLEMQDLRRWFCRGDGDHDILYSKVSYLHFLPFRKKGRYWIQSTKELGPYEKELERRKKESKRIKALIEEITNENYWKKFGQFLEQETKRTMENLQQMRAYLENIESDSEREKAFQSMSNRVIKNWENLDSAALENKKEEAIHYLQLPLEIIQLPEMREFAKKSFINSLLKN